MFVAYNIRRIMNIIEKNELKKYLRQAAFSFSVQMHNIWLNFSCCKAIKFIKGNIEQIFYHPLKKLKFDQLLIKSNSF